MRYGSARSAVCCSLMVLLLLRCATSPQLAALPTLLHPRATGPRRIPARRSTPSGSIRCPARARRGGSPALPPPTAPGRARRRRRARSCASTRARDRTRTAFAVDQQPVDAVAHEVAGGDDVARGAVPQTRQRVREEHLVGVLRAEHVADAERAVRRSRRLRRIARRTRSATRHARRARRRARPPRSVAHRVRVDVDRLAVQLDLPGDVHALVEVPSAPERRHAGRVRVRRSQPFEDEVGLERAGIRTTHAVLVQRFEHLEVVAVRQLDVAEVHRVGIGQRQVAQVHLVERARRRRVPHPRTAVADALVEEHLVVEPAAELALGMVERDPERLGLVRVVAHRVEASRRRA